MKHAHTCFLSALLAAGLSLAAAMPCRAELLAYEGFDYPEAAEIVGQTGGFGFTEGWKALKRNKEDVAPQVSVATPGETFTGLAVVGNKAKLAPETVDARLIRTLATPLDTAVTPTLYLSCLAQNTTEGSRYVGVQLYGGENGYLELFFLGQNSNNPCWAASILTIENKSGIWCGVRKSSSRDLAFLVARLDFNVRSPEGKQTARLRFYINPLPDQPEPGFATMDSFELDPSRVMTLPDVKRLGFAAGYDVSQSPQTVGIIDEIRLGTTWADVVGKKP